MTKIAKVVQRQPKSMKCFEELEQRKVPLSVKEAAKIYGDSIGTFYKKIRRGEIPGVFREAGKPKGRIKICPAEYVVFLKQQISAGCRSANGGAKTPTNGKEFLAKDDEHPQNGSEATSAEKRVGKEDRRLAG